MMNIRLRTLGVAAVLAAALATPATAEVPADFKRLADSLADAVRQIDDDATLEYAGQLRALGRALGNEINLIEAEALSRRHNNDAALSAVKKYLSGKMRQPARAKALKKELDARLDAPNKTWERTFDETNYGTFAAYEDGTFYRVMTVNNDLAYRNTVVERYDATSGPLWRMVYDGSVYTNYMDEPLLSINGRIIVPVRHYSRGWTEDIGMFFQKFWGRGVGVDPMGRLTFKDGHITFNDVPWNQGFGKFAPDGEGGFYAFKMKSGNAASWLTRFNESGDEVWSAPMQTSQHPIGAIKSLMTDDAGNAYVWSSGEYTGKALRKKGMYLDIYGPFGQKIRSMPFSGSKIVAGHRLYDNFAPEKLAISGDGAKIFTATSVSPTRQRSSGRMQANEIVVSAYAFPSMLHLWSRTINSEQTFTDKMTLHPYRDGVVFFSTSQPLNQDVIDYRLRRLDGASGVVMWERKRSFNAKLKNFLSTIDVRPTGIFVASQEGLKSSLAFLSNAEVASLETDPSLEPPQTDIWPFSNEIRENAAREIAAARAETERKEAAARALNMQNEIQAEYNAAEQSMRQCQLAKAAENGVGVLKTVDTDFGFVVIKMNTDFATNKDLSVVLADGRLAPLTFGKAPNKWEISAMPGDAAQIKSMAPGQIVVSKEGIPESKCPEQKIALDTARGKMAEVKRALAPAYIPANTNN